MAAGTILTRFLPFILFPDGKQMPRYVEYLGHVLPYATMGILVVYCLKGVSLFQHRSIPEFLACALVAVLHAWKRNSLLSIGGRNCILYDSGADGVCLDDACFCLRVRAIGNSVFCFRSGFPQIWLIHFRHLLAGRGSRRHWQGCVDGSLIALNASLFYGRSVMHFSRQPAVCKSPGWKRDPE